jgi:hypothetical protein
MRGMLGALAAMALGMGSIIQPDRARERRDRKNLPKLPKGQF